MTVKILCPLVGYPVSDSTTDGLDTEVKGLTVVDMSPSRVFSRRELTLDCLLT